MIKNILHIGSPIVLGYIVYYKGLSDTLGAPIALFSFLAWGIYSLLYNEGHFRESEYEILFKYWDKLDKENGNYKKRKEDFFPYKYDAWKCTIILIFYTIAWLVYMFFIK